MNLVHLNELLQPGWDIPISPPLTVTASEASLRQEMEMMYDDPRRAPPRTVDIAVGNRRIRLTEREYSEIRSEYERYALRHIHPERFEEYLEDRYDRDERTGRGGLNQDTIDHIMRYIDDISNRSTKLMAELSELRTKVETLEESVLELETRSNEQEAMINTLVANSETP